MVYDRMSILLFGLSVVTGANINKWLRILRKFDYRSLLTGFHYCSLLTGSRSNVKLHQPLSVTTAERNHTSEGPRAHKHRSGPCLHASSQLLTACQPFPKQVVCVPNTRLVTPK